MGKKTKGRHVNGIIVLDKLVGDTSNRSLQQIKRLFNASKAGHTGSLDPIATGVLPLCLGEATKLSQFLLDADKRYRAWIRLGVKTASGDADGEVISASPVAVTRPQLLQSLAAFRGEIQQTPPMYSALKHKGVPLYKLARKGQTVAREPRKVSIYSLELLSFQGDDVEIEIHCSKGTYIRAIADELGDALGVGAHVFALRRRQAGPYDLEASVTLAELASARDESGFAGLDRHLAAPDTAVAHLEKVVLPQATAIYLRHGQAVIVRHLPPSGLVRLYQEEQFIGVGKILDDGRVAPSRLLNLNLLKG